MQRRTYLKLFAASASGLSAASGTAVAADSTLDCGVWYDGEITDNVDGDTFDVYVYSNDTTYDVRTLGHDTPEKSGNTSYEKTEEWEFIEDGTHLEDWGNKASTFAEDELPVGTECQIKLDCESEEVDQYGRLLAKIRYDRNGDGTMDTIWNELTLREGYARVYAASMSNTDEYVALQETARANGKGVWGAADDSAPSWRNDDVAETFHPHTSSIKTTGGKLASSRAPIWAEPEAGQENTSSSTVDYSSGSIPMVGVDEANNLAYFGGVSINEKWEDDSSALEHFVFVTNLIDHLHDSSDPSGPVLVDGGHHTFNQDNAVSGEDVAFYQRYLEGQDIELHSINTYGDSTGYSLSDARALICSTSPDSWTSSEITEVSNFISNGGAVLLMGSGSETASERDNLDALADGLGTDLRLNYDDVRDDTNNVGTRKLLKTSNLNTTDFSLWSAYGGSGGTDDSIIEFGTVNRYPHSTLNDEYVDVTNTGSADQDMSDWTLENGEGDTYTFPSGFTLTAGGTVRVHTGSGTDSSSDGDLYWGASMFRWDNDADTASIYDDSGDLIRDTSWTIEDVIVPLVNEDGDTLNDEYVDFENVSGASVDFSGWRVEDEAGNTYNFPSDFSLSAGSTVRLHTGDGTDSSSDLYWGSGSYVWNNSGDTVYLYDDGDNLVQIHEYPSPFSFSIPEISLSGDTLNDEYVDVNNDGSAIVDMSGFTLQDEAGYTYTFPDSFALDAGATVRVHTGDGTDTTTDLYWGRSSGVWNDDGDTAYVFDDNTIQLASKTNDGSSDGDPQVGTINEDGDTLNDEWVEFDNVGSSDQDMTGWAVEDEAGHHYDFPDSYTITSGGTCRLHTGDGTDSSTDGDLYWGSGTYVWNNSGDTVYLYDDTGSLYDSKTY